MFGKDLFRRKKAGFDMESLVIKIKPFMVTVAPERSKLYSKLAWLISEVERILNQESLPVQIRLQAMSLLGKIIKISAGILEDMDLDEIQRDLEQLKKEIKLLDEAEEK